MKLIVRSDSFRVIDNIISHTEHICRLKETTVIFSLTDYMAVSLIVKWKPTEDETTWQCCIISIEIENIYILYNETLMQLLMPGNVRKQLLNTVNTQNKEINKSITYLLEERIVLSLSEPDKIIRFNPTNSSDFIELESI